MKAIHLGREKLLDGKQEWVIFMEGLERRIKN